MDLTSLEARVTHLERQNRHLRLVVVAGVSLALLGIARDRDDSVHLVSDDGTSEVTLTHDRLVFKRDGQNQVALLADGKNNSFTAFSPDQQGQVILFADGLGFRVGGKGTVELLSRGEKQSRGLLVRDADERARAAVLLTTEGRPAVRLLGSTEKIVSQLTIDEGDLQRLAFTRGQGKLVAAMRNGDDWSGCMAVSENAEATLALERDGTPRTTLVSSSGKRRDSKP